MVLLILAVIWAAVLIPPRLRARAEGRPADSIGAFRRHLGVLQRTGPHALLPQAINPAYGTIPIRPAPAASPLWSATAMAESRRRQTQARRREVFMGLVISMGATFVLGIPHGMRVFWALHLVLDLLFAGYVALLVHLRNLATERTTKVRYLRPAGPMVEPALALRRSVN
ncbi:MAG TPA: hypothetical protein VFB78_12805 [Acidimicrobiales bacterium]|nr:hypothetical protein [Acidimicrobiales bacterium]